MAENDLPFVAFPDEKSVMAAVANMRKPDETWYHNRLAYLTNQRVVAYDAQEGVCFSHRYKEIQRAELDKSSFWRGWVVSLHIEGGGLSTFRIAMSLEQYGQARKGEVPFNVEDRALMQRWVNKVNEYILVHRPR